MARARVMARTIWLGLGLGLGIWLGLGLGLGLEDYGFYSFVCACVYESVCGVVLGGGLF